MTRQNSENTIKRFLNSREAQSYLTISRRALETAVKNGEIGYKKINSRLYFPVEELDRWAQQLNYHTDCINEGIYTGHISRSLTKPEHDIGLEKLLELRRLEKLKNTASKGLQSCSKRVCAKQPVSCPA